ncbi:MAG: nucleoside monophosphate kinase [Gemmatimonadota bacterium]
MRKFIVMGPQGCGKGTQAKLLCTELDLVHISVGDIFRWHVQHHTKLGARVKRIVASGQLVPDEMVNEVMLERLELHDWNFGFVLDGFPRDQAQATFFLERFDVDAVLLIDVPDAVVLERIMSRRLCSQCGLDYNLIFHRPAAEGVCDVCQGALVSRADDTLEAVQARLGDYRTKTQPIIELFRRKELVLTFDGTRPATEIQTEIRKQVGGGR